MENFIISQYLRLFELLTIEVKLELLSKLTENIKGSFKKRETNKTQLLNELCGAWSDVDEEAMINVIYEGRTISDKTINFHNIQK